MTTETMDTEDLRLRVYRTFRDTGRAPTTTELATSMSLPPDRIRQGLRQLAWQRHLVLDGERIVMAHPFSAIPMGFSVMGRNTLWWGGCCWDSFALAHVLPDEPNVLERGATMDLKTLWHLARNWYDGRLERGYQRREPGDAIDYLRSVGLTGPFWGTS